MGRKKSEEDERAEERGGRKEMKRTETEEYRCPQIRLDFREWSPSSHHISEHANILARIQRQ